MFGRKNKPIDKPNPHNNQAATNEGPLLWDVPVFFGIMFVLSLVELCFTVFSFQHLARHHEFYHDEEARLGFLIFSAARTILLSGGYIYAHFRRKSLSMWRMIFLVVSTILWIISGVIIHHMYGYYHCHGIGKLKGGINECHTTKIVEIIAWVLAAVSVIAAIPQMMGGYKKFRAKRAAKHSEKNASRV